MMSLRHNSSKESGFTIVELMIATLIFAIILVVITSGVIHFTEAYYKGVHTSSTQTIARNVMNIIGQNLQYGGGEATLVQSDPADPSVDKYICVGDTQIDYRVGAQLGTDSQYGVFVTTVDSSGECKPFTASLIGHGRELLSPNMRLTDLTVVQSNNLYEIKAGVAYGDLDLLCAQSISPATAIGGCAKTAPRFVDYTALAAPGATLICKPVSGSQYCAVSHLSSQVVARFQVPN
jgi:prepilin-type N-terminal cleavage/methylation domain-containing protein